MCNHLSALLAFGAFCVLGVPARADTAISDDTLKSVFRNPKAFNLTNRNQGSTPIVNMNGNYNYQATQQVFFISGAPQSVSKGMRNCVTYLERDDYTILPGMGVYKIHKRKVNWNKARKSCMDEGAQLAVINSDEEEQLFRTWKAANSVSAIWIGVHDLFQQDSWTTLLGEPLAAKSYDIWAPNRPDNAGGIEHCGVVWDNPPKGIDDCPCDRKYEYICEMELC